MADDDQRVEELDVNEVYQKIQNGEGVVLDVREPEELQQVSLTGVIHIPLNELPAKVDEVPKDQDVFVLCHAGQRSAMATQYLRQSGHTRVWNIRGGIISWLRARLPANWSSAG